MGGRANNPNYSAFFKQLLEAFVFLMYPKCWSFLTLINLSCKDHKSSDNLLYFSNIFSVKYIKQILVKHSIEKGERLEGIFPLWYALHFLEFLMKHRCFNVPTRMVSHDQIDPWLISETLLPFPLSKYIAFFCWMNSAEFAT